MVAVSIIVIILNRISKRPLLIYKCITYKQVRFVKFGLNRFCSARAFVRVCVFFSHWPLMKLQVLYSYYILLLSLYVLYIIINQIIVRIV